jgi:hypothetical protein
MITVVILFTGLLTLVDPSRLNPPLGNPATVLLLPGPTGVQHDATLQLDLKYVDQTKPTPGFCVVQNSTMVCTCFRKEISLLPAPLVTGGLVRCNPEIDTVKSLSVPTGYVFDQTLLGSQPTLPITRMPLRDGVVCGTCRIKTTTGHDVIFQEVDANHVQSGSPGPLASAIKYTADPRDAAGLKIHFAGIVDNSADDLWLIGTKGSPEVVVAVLPSGSSPGKCAPKVPDSSMAATCPRVVPGLEQLPHYAAFSNMWTKGLGSTPMCHHLKLLYYDPLSLLRAPAKGKAVTGTIASLGDPLCPPTQLP